MTYTSPPPATTETYWLGVTGSRQHPSRATVTGTLRQRVATLRLAGVSLIGIVSGGAKGPDTWAAELGKELELPVHEYMPNLQGLEVGSPRFEVVKRYYARNRLIVHRCNELWAFPSEGNGLKGGTANTIQQARELGRPVAIIPPAFNPPAQEPSPS